MRSSSLADFLVQDSADAVHEYGARNCQSPVPSEQSSLSEAYQFQSVTSEHEQVFIKWQRNVLCRLRIAGEVRRCI